MGQYFKVVNTKTLQFMDPAMYGDGVKLTEHCYITNSFVDAVMSLLRSGDIWFNSPIVWCGDYYDKPGETPYFDLVKDENHIVDVKPIDNPSEWILVNFTKKEYVNLSTLKADNNGYTMNPLCLLTALGNDRGGGDYDKTNPDFDKVGIWAFDNIGIVKIIPYGYWELKTGFRDDC